MEFVIVCYSLSSVDGIPGDVIIELRTAESVCDVVFVSPRLAQTCLSNNVQTLFLLCLFPSFGPPLTQQSLICMKTSVQVRQLPLNNPLTCWMMVNATVLWSEHGEV